MQYRINNKVLIRRIVIAAGATFIFTSLLPFEDIEHHPLEKPYRIENIGWSYTITDTGGSSYVSPKYGTIFTEN